MLAGSDHVITAMNDITAVTSFDASERWLSRGCSVLLFVSAATTVTERDTGRLETPGCLRPRWAASSLGELAPNPPLNLVNSRSLLWFSSHSCLSSCSRFLLPEYLPYAGIFHERGQPGLATHSSVNRVLAGMHTHLYLKRRRLISDLRQDTVTTKLFCFFFSSNGDVGYRACPVTPFPVLHRGVDRGRSVCGRQQHRQHHVPPAVVGLHQV